MNMAIDQARELMLARCGVVGAESVPLAEAMGRVLAEDVLAADDVPPFAKSPYDGYAFRAVDSADASRDHPVTLTVLETVAAGSMPSRVIVPGTAARIMTGAPIPEGADTVVMYELTDFTDRTVTLYAAASPGNDIVPAGEDIRAGARIANRGDVIDPGLAGSLASVGTSRLKVFRMPRVGLISTGNEVVEADQPVTGAFIRNSNRYALAAACARAGAEPVYLGRVGDVVEDIAALMSQGLETCDVVFSTGGVSVGDFDLTPAALEMIGAEITVRGVRMKPGGACAYGIRDGKLLFGLSGNPSSALINFYALAWPCLRKLSGRGQIMPPPTRVTLADAFNKKSPNTRLITGRLDLSDGVVRMRVTTVQGNAILRTLIGCDVLAVIPAGSPPLPAGTVLDAWLL